MTTDSPAPDDSLAPNYLEGNAADPSQIAGWVEQFHRDGFLFLRNVLRPGTVRQLKDDLERALSERQDDGGGAIDLRCRMFETSDANLRLFDLEPIVTFAEALVEPGCHVVHNNAFRTALGQGITAWHQDDAPHYTVTHGEPPTNVRLPVLLFTCNYYLTDVPTVAHGPTQLVPGSHLYGGSPPAALEGTAWADRVVSCLGAAGSVVMFNNQVWHRGAPNTSGVARAITQVSYGRRMVSHFFFPFMNYQMPAHCYEHAPPRLRRLLGFLPSGAYG